MRTMYIECKMGAAGDMLTAALLELHPEPEQFIKDFHSLGLEGVKLQFAEDFRAGIRGHRMHVSIHEEEEVSLDILPGKLTANTETPRHPHTHSHAHDHTHTHDHAHTHSHSHNTLADIQRIIQGLKLVPAVKKDALAVYDLLAEAESNAHGKGVNEIHFHEVGMLDAVADIVAVSYLMQELAPERVVVSPIHVGNGHVQCAHGILPVPVPAVEYLLRGIPSYSGDIQGELCTPTGAALLRYFADDFASMPLLNVEKVGYGLGTKVYPVANMLRIFLGESVEPAAAKRPEFAAEQVVEMKCNLDDMTGEDLAFLVDLLLAAGAPDVYITPVFMKKGRPAYVLTCLAHPQQIEDLSLLIFRHSSTFGLRFSTFERYTMDREEQILTSAYGSYRIKRGTYKQVQKQKLEYEDLARMAREGKLPLRELREKLTSQGSKPDTE